MTKIKTKDKEIEVKDGEAITDACEQLGVHMGCREGVCGSCVIRIEEGAENLSDLTQEEKNMEMNKEKRLACQCKIKGGEVKFVF